MFGWRESQSFLDSPDIPKQVYENRQCNPPRSLMNTPGLWCWAVLLLSLALVEAAEVDYSAQCSFNNGKFVTCVRALFSPGTFDVSSRGFLLENHGCPTNAQQSRRGSGEVAVVHRGACSFEEKSRFATKQGYSALVIINNESETFPVGASDPQYTSSIPIVMVGSDSFQGAEFPLASFTLNGKVPRKSGIIPMLNQQLADHLPVLKTELAVVFYFSVVVGIRLLLSTALSEPVINTSWTSQHFGSWSQLMLWVLFVAIFVFFFVITRIATLRPMDPHPVHAIAHLEYPLLDGYDHTETDELIFEHLIRSVHRDPYDYRLQGKPIIDLLALARENYDHALFLHPPFFVYTASWLHYHAHIPLPLVIVFYQSITLLCLPILAWALLQGSSLSLCSVQRVSLRAMLFFALCPLTWFCSQKLWIDNALLSTCSMALTLHVILFPLMVSHPESRMVKGFKHLFSGLVYGGIALNSKVTSLALLPILAVWSLAHLYCHITVLETVRQQGLRKKTDSYAGTDDADGADAIEGNRSGVVRPSWTFLLIEWLGLHGVLFLIGALAGHLPWLLWYHKETGRWLPSAWPSATMLQRFDFVRQAVQRPWYHYLHTLASITPLHLVALLFGTACLCVWIHVTVREGSILVALGRSSRNHISTAPSPMATQWQTGSCSLITRCALLSLLPLSFLLGNNLLGLAGAGYQLRFLLPMTPVSCLLSSLFVELIQPRSPNDNMSNTNSFFVFLDVLMQLALVYTAITGWYYAVQCPTRHADLLPTGGLLDMLFQILSTPLSFVDGMTGTTTVTPEHVQNIQKVWQQTLRHHGLLA